jgi:hypothetical protein
MCDLCDVGKCSSWSCHLQQLFDVGHVSISYMLGPSHPHVQQIPGLIPWCKVAGQEIDHSPPSSVEVMKLCYCTSTLHPPAWLGPN